MRGVFLGMIKNVRVVGFNDFRVGVGDEEVGGRDIGGVGGGMRGGEVR